MNEPTYVSVQVASELSQVPETIILSAILARTVRTHKHQGCLFVVLEDVERLLVNTTPALRERGAKHDRH